MCPAGRARCARGGHFVAGVPVGVSENAWGLALLGVGPFFVYSPKLTDSMPRNSADWPSCFFDAEELVVFGDAVGAAGGAGFDLAGAGADGEVGDEGVFGFAASGG